MVTIKKLIPNNIKHLLKKSFIALNNYEIKELKKIKKKKRFELGKTSILNFNFEYVDSASFLFIFNEVFQKGIYKFNCIKSAPRIIDCGANIGLSTIYFKKLFPKSEIIAFEPDPFIFKTLVKNINNSGFEGVTTINKAVWDSETMLSFYSDGADGGSIFKNSENKKIDVETTTLHNYLNKEVDFLKIDIEGAETVVLKNIEPLLKNVLNLFIEYHSYSIEDQKLQDILTILTKNNFRYYIEHIGIKSNNPFVKIEQENKMDNQLNIFAYKQS